MLDTSPIPVVELERLSFLLDAYSGEGIFWPLEGSPIAVQAISSGFWEEGERFVRFEFCCHTGGTEVMSVLNVITYNPACEGYSVWSFSNQHVAPIPMGADFEGDTFVLVSQPGRTNFGILMLRVRFTPYGDGDLSVTTEYWTPTGYVKLLDVILHRTP